MHRAVGNCLLQEKAEGLQKQAQLEQQVEEVRARLDRKEADWAARQERHEEYVQQINVGATLKIASAVCAHPALKRALHGAGACEHIGEGEGIVAVGD
jgi:molecular chaperone GrpE (heat shock protein)